MQGRKGFWSGEPKYQGLKATIAVSTLIALMGLLAACGEATAVPTAPAAAVTTGAGAGAGAADPYAGLNAEQVMDTYLKAYQAKDFNTCRALLSKSVLAGWSSPDELKLQEQAQEKQYGQLQVKIFGVLSDQGNLVTYLVQFQRTGVAPATPNYIFTPVFTATPNIPTTAVTRSGNFEVKREGNTWKISNYTVI